MMKTDAQIQHDVMEELKWEPAVTATSVGVGVADGVVTLSGHVESFSQKWAAERAAQRVSGVKALAVELDVRLTPLTTRPDADLARSAENVLEWVSYLPTNSIKVMVEKGWITLTGAVDWDYQRHNAASAVRHLMGVVGVSNEVALKPQVSSTRLKAEIEDVLKRRTNGNAERIAVEVDGHTVTLTGSVGSWYQRHLATRSAWGSRGVTLVVDNLSVSHA